MGKCCDGTSSVEAGAIASLNTSREPNKRVYKVVIVGQAGVGKTSVTERMLGFPFEPNITATLGIEFKIKTIKIANMEIKVQMWDSAGQERFRAITTTYFANAHLVIFVYDVNQKATFDDLVEYWIGDAETKSRNSAYLKVLIGNKTDLLQPGVKEPIEEERVKALTMLPGWMYARTSAKMQTNEVLKQLLATIVDRLLQNDPTIDFEALMREDSKLRSAQLLVDEAWENNGESSDDSPPVLVTST